MGGEMLPALPDGFAAVVDCRLLEDFAFVNLTNRCLLWVPFLDCPTLPPAWLIQMGIDFVGVAMVNRLKTLVHCAEGHNRSGLIVAAYLIGGGWAPGAAIALIRSKRPGALSNQVFVDYLMKL